MMRVVPRSRAGKICTACAIFLVLAAGFLGWDKQVQSAQSGGNQELTEPDGLAPQTGEPGMTSLLLRTFLSLLVVLALVYLIVYGLKRLILQRNGGRHSPLSLKVVGSTFLGPKKAVYLVQVADRVLILGVTDSQVSLLSEITDQEILTCLQASPGGVQKARGGSFAEHLTTLLKGTRKNDG